MLEEEAWEAAEEKRMYLEDRCPTLSTPDSMQSLQVNLPLEPKVRKSNESAPSNALASLPMTKRRRKGTFSVRNVVLILSKQQGC